MTKQIILLKSLLIIVDVTSFFFTSLINKIRESLVTSMEEKILFWIIAYIYFPLVSKTTLNLTNDQWNECSCLSGQLIDSTECFDVWWMDKTDPSHTATYHPSCLSNLDHLQNIQDTDESKEELWSDVLLWTSSHG